MELCRQCGDTDKEKAYQKTHEQLTVSLNEHGWDGQWYRRAFTDAGHWLGSIQNEECRIDAIAQSWSVISGAAPRERAIQAMKSFDRELVERDLSVIRLLTPPFDHTEPSPGYIQKTGGARTIFPALAESGRFCPFSEANQAAAQGHP
jgi:cyclic beta-1,2-glucan synthetase